MRLRILLILLVATSVFADEAGTAHRFDQIRINPLLLRRFLEAMPKGGDLHEHLSGAVYAETYLDWAMQDGLCIDKAQLTIANPPCDEPHGLVPAKSMNDALRSQLIDALSMRNFHPAADNGHDHFFATFTKFRAVSARHVPEMLANVATRFASENVDYLESLFDAGSGAAARFGATLTPGASFAEMRDALLKSGKVPEIVAFSSRNLDQIDAAAHKASPNTTIRYLVQVHRGIPREQFFSELVIAFELAGADPRVVGLNPVMPEDGYASMKNFDDQMEMFAYLRPLYPTVRLTAHAGELAPGLVPPEGLRNHIRDTVMIAKAERIGHGVDVARETNMPELLRTMSSRGVAVEICLTSNDVILGVKGANHPLRLYLQNHVPVVLATDDPGVSRGDLTTEFQRAAEEHNLGYRELKRIARNSLQYSFLEGASLWTNGEYASYACGNACDALIKKSAKAREQWRFEQRLREFENATSPAD
ncbi:MAG TPA: adenosine deaminase [Thermoanaerobaculia bacterium]|nr:adenosine deaminase [Thermoanaerobaculia bacterium]